MTVVIVLREAVTPAERWRLVERVGESAATVQVHSPTLLSAGGDAAAVQAAIGADPAVHSVAAIPADYPKAARASAPRGTTLRVGPLTVGGGEFAVIAGPCSVESRDQLLTTARAVHRAGAHALRGGMFKPRTSPYSFQGLGAEAVDLVVETKEVTGLPFVSEIVDVRDVEVMAECVDVLQIGARNMQNYALLREVGMTRIPVLLKRGLAATVDETLLAAEYLLDGGNDQVAICERGIRTFENSYRFTLDLAAVAVFRERTHLPIVVDPSHAAGQTGRVMPLALAAAAGGADGIIVESHCDPATAKCDGNQALPTGDLPELMRRLEYAVSAAGRRLVPHRPGLHRVAGAPRPVPQDAPVRIAS
ncbi:3-deoxy-7-phosphoheptulonate synthase [Actinomadura verrucosospora]|uniref:3-deoxy-D-arabinoheptulosonate-7-phosphate synthase n=1 Tax=Actinomadura verrucosospora TaxID=46165 RepID=A0A7D3VVV6_ACTVE|nr:3-deoxy-7-phosphoheptulonate synthase [Actinomadura verrucosospora]QKG19892.1 3-deoxy-D-arabinoheptulosonate-7-phosphate synthase [Actinomadura verrucosospora]